MHIWLFYIFSTITVAATILMIAHKNTITSAMSLVVSLCSLAALFLLLHAPFVAAVQIIVYAGAIMVLFIFVIMMLQIPKPHQKTTRFGIKHLLVGSCGCMLFAFFFVAFATIPQVSFKTVTADFGSAQQVGETLFSKYVIPFELLGVLLLSGLVGAL